MRTRMNRIACLGCGLITVALATTTTAAMVDEGGNVVSGGSGPDITFCQLDGLRMNGDAFEGIVGLSMATTSWNVGDQLLEWHRVPDSRHPFIAQNLYRLENDRFEQIGQAWVKHAFFALSNTQCGGECERTDGQHLGINCTDTYSPFNNSRRGSLGPRFEINPWTGDWQFEGSMFDVGGPPTDNDIRRRLQVFEHDIDPAQHPDAQYFAEGYYAHFEDINVMNSVAWKPTTPVGSPGEGWTFEMTPPADPPNIGFAIDAWVGARQTMLAQEVPPVEFQSPDGRCILAAKATDLGGGVWHYEYALLNIDMDRQGASFNIPLPPNVTVTNIGFHASRHHDEPVNERDGFSIDNDPWEADVSDSAIIFSTAGNPLRWGTIHNYRFDVDAPPGDVEITLGFFKDGDPDSIRGITTGPISGGCTRNPMWVCDGDVDGDGQVNPVDSGLVQSAFGSTDDQDLCNYDVDCDGLINPVDSGLVQSLFGRCNPPRNACP